MREKRICPKFCKFFSADLRVKYQAQYRTECDLSWSNAHFGAGMNKYFDQHFSFNRSRAGQCFKKFKLASWSLSCNLGPLKSLVHAYSKTAWAKCLQRTRCWGTQDARLGKWRCFKLSTVTALALKWSRRPTWYSLRYLMGLLKPNWPSPAY